MKSDILGWLGWSSLPKPSVTHNRLVVEHHKGTGTWFLESNVFEEWLYTPSSFLWIKGMRECDHCDGLSIRLIVAESWERKERVMVSSWMLHL
jgi:hypothetical protein